LRFVDADLALPLAQEALKIYERLQHKDLAEARELVERLKRMSSG
jgi:dihydrodipicolinate synthase/N-acetylneuraminate lyase